MLDECRTAQEWAAFCRARGAESLGSIDLCIQQCAVVARANRCVTGGTDAGGVSSVAGSSGAAAASFGGADGLAVPLRIPFSTDHAAAATSELLRDTLPKKSSQHVSLPPPPPPPQPNPLAQLLPPQPPPVQPPRPQQLRQRSALLGLGGTLPAIAADAVPPGAGGVPAAAASADKTAGVDFSRADAQPPPPSHGAPTAASALYAAAEEAAAPGLRGAAAGGSASDALLADTRPVADLSDRGPLTSLPEAALSAIPGITELGATVLSPQLLRLTAPAAARLGSGGDAASGGALPPPPPPLPPLARAPVRPHDLCGDLAYSVREELRCPTLTVEPAAGDAAAGLLEPALRPPTDRLQRIAEVTARVVVDTYVPLDRDRGIEPFGTEGFKCEVRIRRRLP